MFSHKKLNLKTIILVGLIFLMQSCDDNVSSPIVSHTQEIVFENNTDKTVTINFKLNQNENVLKVFTGKDSTGWSEYMDWGLEEFNSRSIAQSDSFLMRIYDYEYFMDRHLSFPEFLSLFDTLEFILNDSITYSKNDLSGDNYFIKEEKVTDTEPPHYDTMYSYVYRIE